MDWHCIFSRLDPAHQVQFGLCSQQARSSFWRCLGSKLWYNSLRNTSLIGRPIRKLCINLSTFDAYEGTLDELSHLHITITNEGWHSTEIVLPKNLRYCFISKSYCLTRCTVPFGLIFLETNDHDLQFSDLTENSNLSVLRVMQNGRACGMLLHPNLLELEMYDIMRTSVFPPSLSKLRLYHCNVSDLPKWPNLIECNFITMSIKMQLAKNINIHPSVRHLSFPLNEITEHANLLPLLFPNVTDLKIDCVSQGPYRDEVPIFTNVRTLDLTLPIDASILSDSIQLDGWSNLVNLKLDIVSVSSCDFTRVFIFPHLVRLEIFVSRKIASVSQCKIQVQFPSSLTHARLKSEKPVFDISIADNSKLRTLRTCGNVFKASRRLQFPESLRSFHVRLGRNETMEQSWHPLRNHVDFQVIRE